MGKHNNPLEQYQFLETVTNLETYDYYIFQNKKGIFLVRRSNKTTDSTRYIFVKDSLTNVISNLETYVYKTIGELNV